MKTMTCRELGGPCDLAHRGDSADDIINAQDRHLKELVEAGDDAHVPGPRRHEGPLAPPDEVDGLVQRRQEAVRRAAGTVRLIPRPTGDRIRSPNWLRHRLTRPPPLV